MRTIDENKMVSIEAGDAATVIACGVCAAAIAAALLSWKEMVAMLLTPGSNQLVLKLGETAAKACAQCVYGIVE